MKRDPVIAHYVPERATGRARIRAQEELDSLAAKTDATTHLSAADLSTACNLLPMLGLWAAFGRSLESLRRERAYRERAYFTRTLEIFTHSRTWGDQSDYFGLDGFPGRGPITTQTLRLRFDSLYGREILSYDYDLHGTSVLELEVVGPDPRHIGLLLESEYRSPVFARRRPGQDLPPYRPHRFNSPGLRIRELVHANEYVVRSFGRNRLAGLWEALERVWCELLLRQRPLIRPLTRVSVEARVRALVGRTVWVEHRGGVTIGRCPNVSHFLGSDRLVLATDDAAVPLTDILEIGPWRSHYGRQLVTFG